ADRAAGGVAQSEIDYAGWVHGLERLAALIIASLRNKNQVRTFRRAFRPHERGGIVPLVTKVCRGDLPARAVEVVGRVTRPGVFTGDELAGSFGVVVARQACRGDHVAGG